MLISIIDEINSYLKGVGYVRSLPSFEGNHLDEFPGNVDDCKSRCNKDPQCDAISHNYKDNVCLLKNNPTNSWENYSNSPRHSNNHYLKIFSFYYKKTPVIT